MHRFAVFVRNVKVGHVVKNKSMWFNNKTDLNIVNPEFMDSISQHRAHKNTNMTFFYKRRNISLDSSETVSF